MQVWDRLAEAGAEHGIQPCGYRVLEGLRMEKGYRYMGTDLTGGDTPYEAGLGFCVALDKGEFVGARRFGKRPSGRSRGGSARCCVGSGEQVPVYGGEAVLGGRVTGGRVRSAAYGYTVGRAIAYAYLPADLDPGLQLSVEVLGEQVAGRAGGGRAGRPQSRARAGLSARSGPARGRPGAISPRSGSLQRLPGLQQRLQAVQHQIPATSHRPVGGRLTLEAVVGQGRLPGGDRLVRPGVRIGHPPRCLRAHWRCGHSCRAR